LSIALKELHLYWFMTNLRGLLAKNIKKRRKFLGISQAILAEKANTSSHYIAQIEQKKKFPSSEMLERLAAALEIDSPELFASKTFRDETVSTLQKSINAHIAALTHTISEEISELSTFDN
jgi:transcriptional regulator with XRE-family HTH domain